RRYPLLHLTRRLRPDCQPAFFRHDEIFQRSWSHYVRLHRQTRPLPFPSVRFAIGNGNVTSTP
ncbi:hypothetical protein, partial [Xanthomonas citri]|uniref:hypothetical protein n=1 Tax=Xanthomonas citri TaxID=346 RepID=UPI001F346520